ncbi:penicillin-binding protein 1A [Rhodoplanes sp. Z2-YC6860]|uniref:penicillin-binding protein 1A n=1 Tax=Rhodoplanes sp. Z2-YC6860 TaxID=674703 RepID=UPI00078EA88F|nr:transglycosylase domain-containing protein [Rhodoplanes sp. Z2-YC6860]AMN39488.1 membrane carboxypeptidase/penicillin-binding protein [Rhodoplanes sp. Z2-YC6860]
MEAILVKVFATALALSLVMTRPDTVKTQFDPVQDKAQVLKILGDGCDSMRKAFNIENIDLDGLIETVMTDKQATAGEVAGFKGINFNDLFLAYKQFCKHEKIDKEVVDIGEVIEFYNRAAADLPDHNRLKGLKLPEMTTVYDGSGAKFAELFEPDGRRQWVPLSQIPEIVQKAFIAAEDKRFYEHPGVDIRSVTRAFMNTLGGDKRQGGSTITQQVAKNLLVGDSVTFERKIREVLVATRLEKVLSKQEILEIYLNSIYLGRSAWGVDLASRAYFGKPVKDVNTTEAAFLAGLTKGPAYFNPDKYYGRAQERLAYVLSRLKDDGVINADQYSEAEATKLTFVPVNRVRRDTGFHLVDEIGREARSVANISRLTGNSYQVKSTIQPAIQRAAEAALQEGLAQYEQGAGRVEFRGAEANVGDAIKKLDLDRKANQDKPSWQVALDQVRLPLYDVHWTPAVVVERRGESIRVGLPDGRILPLSTWGARTRSRINLFDVLYVKVIENTNANLNNQKSNVGVRVELRVRPHVQGMTLVMENKTGRILAMVGGFSYPMSQLNRVTQSRRQPGSSLKPLTYLAALAHGLQPNTLVLDASITYPPINGVNRYTRSTDYWSPRNYEGGGSGTTTLRRGLEQSKNLVTARLLDGGIGDTPQESLDTICALAVKAQIYPQCVRFYPFVLGAQPVRPIDLAGFYGAIANEGKRPTPHVIEQISLDGKVLYKADESLKPLPVDPAAVFQLRTLLQGVVARGTAARMSSLSSFVGGKTGTSDDFNDAWFMGFSKDVTIGVWVGYDNAKGKRTLGQGQQGSRVALPIFQSIMKSVWADYAPQQPLPGPSPEADRRLIALPIDLHSGARIETRSRSAFMEYFRLDESGRLDESQYRLVSRNHDYSVGSDDDYDDGRSSSSGGGGFFFPPFFSRRFESQSQPSYRARESDSGFGRRPPRGAFPQQQYEPDGGRGPFGGFFGGGRTGGF